LNFKMRRKRYICEGYSDCKMTGKLKGRGFCSHAVRHCRTRDCYTDMSGKINEEIFCFRAKKPVKCVLVA